MGLDLKDLKLEFRDYLIDCGIIKEDHDDSDKVQSESIFAHKEEFKDFVAEKYGINLDTPSSSIFELSELEINDGQVALLDENSNMNGGGNKDANFMISFLNSLLQENDFVEKLSSGEDTSLNDEEILKFLVYASSQDDVDEKLTFDDILFGYENAQNGEYNLDEVSLDILEKVDEAPEIQGADETDKVDESPAPSYGGGISGGTPNYNVNNTTVDEADENDITRMDLTELKAERDLRATAVSDVQNNIVQVQTQYKDYLSQGKEELQAQMNEISETDKESMNIALEYQNKVTDKKIEISDSKTKIAEFDASLIDLQSQKRIAEAQVTSYANALASVPPDDAKNSYQAQRNQINAAKAAAEALVKELSEKIGNTEQQREAENQRLKELDTQLTELQSSESEEKIKYDEAKAKLSEDANALLDEYNAFVSDMDSQISTLETMDQNAQKSLAEVEALIIKKNDIEAQRMANPSEFDPNGNGYTLLEMERKDGILPYDVIAPKNADPNEELPVLVYMHGQNSNHLNIYNNIFENYNLETWNGYIICLDNDDANDWGDNIGDIDNVLADFSSQYKIDRDRISIAGYSLGGSGVVQMNNSGALNDYRNAAVITAYLMPKNNQFDIPFMAFNDSDSGDKTPLFREIAEKSDKSVYVDTGVSHRNVDEDAFTRDDNKNGKADIFEFFEGSLE